MLDTDLIEEKLISTGHFDGVASRWTILTKLRNLEDPNMNITSIAYIIDSKKERYLNIGSNFSKTQLGRREAIASEMVMKTLGINAGEDI